MDVAIIKKGEITMPRPPSKKSRTAARYNLDLATRIKSYRQARGLTQAMLAKRADISQRAISSYEMGHRRLPAEVLFKIARALKVTILELSNGKSAPPPAPKNGRKVRAVVEKLESLPPKKQREAINYIEYLSNSDKP